MFLFFREAINIAVLEMSEDGTLNTLKRRWWYDRSECHSGTAKVCRKFNTNCNINKFKLGIETK
jgi:hypothetical protein